MILKSYRHARKPTQAELIRRIVRSQSRTLQPVPDLSAKTARPSPAGVEVPPETLTERMTKIVPETLPETMSTNLPENLPANLPANLAGTDPVQAFAIKSSPGSGLDVSGGSPSLRPRPPRVLAFLAAEEFKQGLAPWAVPLSTDMLRIGRHQENDIRLEDKTVHRYHALLHRSPDGDFLIRDLSGDQGNGVYVNGARIAQTQLRPGDLVELGAVRLRFQQQRPS